MKSEILKLKFVQCTRGAYHQGEQLNTVCLNPECKAKALCCCACIDEFHKGHQMTTLKKLLLDAGKVVGRDKEEAKIEKTGMFNADIILNLIEENKKLHLCMMMYYGNDKVEILPVFRFDIQIVYSAPFLMLIKVIQNIFSINSYQQIEEFLIFSYIMHYELQIVIAFKLQTYKLQIQIPYPSSPSRMQNDQGLDDVIDFLNKNDIPNTKPKPVTHKSPNPQLQQNLQNLQLNPDNILNFQAVYEKRLEKIEKKNQQKDEKEFKRMEMLQKAKKIGSDPKIFGKDEPIKLPPIRHLVFKPFSGNHLNYEIKDNGYKFKFSNGVVALVKHLLQENGFVESTNNEAHIIWNIGVVQPSVYQTMGAYMKINHFPKTYEITRKDLMLQNLSKMRAKYPTHYNFYPKTFILPNEVAQFLQQSQKDRKLNKWYIVKPSNKSQGKGIWLSDKPEQILQKQKESMVVSEYVYNPLLVNGLKFDMRIYVGITCYNPLRIYIFENGLARFATSDYSFDPSSKENLLAHLTNYSLNKFSQNFVANDQEMECKGHKWSLIALKDYFRKANIDVTLIWSRIEDMIIKTIISIQNKVFGAMQMSVPYRDNCFQILGFDVLIDENLRPWLLQINLSPSLNTDSNLDLTIKGAMLADMFTMMGVVSLDQRFSFDKTYILNQNKASSKTLKNDYPKLEKLVIAQSQQQEKRSGGWKKIFPTETGTRYKQFFDIDRPLNRLLRDEELKKFKARNPGVNINQMIKQLNENPQVDRKK